MNRICLFLMITLLCVSSLAAQESGRFVPGYYITSGRDTVRGYIAEQFQIVQANSYQFKISPDAKESQRLLPDEVTRFYYEPNFHFRSMTVERSGKESVVFLRQLVKGFAELYQTRGPGRPTYVLTLASGERLQLEKQDSIVRDHVKLDKEYLGKMKYLFRDCNYIVKNNRRIDFTQQMLARFVHSYNKCAHSDQPHAIYLNREKLKFSLGAQAGVTHTLVDGSSGILSFDGNGTGWSAGLILELYFLRQFSFRTGLNYFTYAAESIREFSFGVDNFRHEVTSLEIPVNLKFQFNRRQFIPYLYAGMNIPINVELTEQFSRFEFGTFTIEREQPPTLERYLFMINGGVGMNFLLSERGVLFLNLDYDYKDGSFNTGSFRPQRFTLTTGIIF